MLKLSHTPFLGIASIIAGGSQLRRFIRLLRSRVLVSHRGKHLSMKHEFPLQSLRIWQMQVLPRRAIQRIMLKLFSFLQVLVCPIQIAGIRPGLTSDEVRGV